MLQGSFTFASSEYHSTISRISAAANYYNHQPLTTPLTVFTYFQYMCTSHTQGRMLVLLKIISPDNQYVLRIHCAHFPHHRQCAPNVRDFILRTASSKFKISNLHALSWLHVITTHIHNMIHLWLFQYVYYSLLTRAKGVTMQRRLHWENNPRQLVSHYRCYICNCGPSLEPYSIYP